MESFKLLLENIDLDRETRMFFQTPVVFRIGDGLEPKHVVSSGLDPIFGVF